MPRLEEVANVALRVPSILVLDLLYKCDIEGLTDRLKARNEDMLFKYKYLIWNLYYIGERSHARPESELWCVSTFVSFQEQAPASGCRPSWFGAPEELRLRFRTS